MSSKVNKYFTSVFNEIHSQNVKFYHILNNHQEIYLVFEYIVIIIKRTQLKYQKFQYGVSIENCVGHYFKLKTFDINENIMSETVQLFMYQFILNLKDVEISLNGLKQIELYEKYLYNIKGETFVLSRNLSIHDVVLERIENLKINIKQKYDELLIKINCIENKFSTGKQSINVLNEQIHENQLIISQITSANLCFLLQVKNQKFNHEQLIEHNNNISLQLYIFFNEYII